MGGPGFQTGMAAGHKKPLNADRSHVEAWPMGAGFLQWRLVGYADTDLKIGTTQTVPTKRFCGGLGECLKTCPRGRGHGTRM